MLDPKIVAECKRMLAEPAGQRMSQRGIARTLGICRASVSKIARGSRPDYEARKAGRARPGVPEADQVDVDRCRTCGAKTEQPCRACRDRAAKREHAAAIAAIAEGQVRLAVELKGADAKRYDEVHDRKVHESRSAELPQFDGEPVMSFCDEDGEPIEQLQAACPCGQPLVAVIPISATGGRAARPRFFVRRHGRLVEVRCCPSCRRSGFTQLSADRLKATTWAS